MLASKDLTLDQWNRVAMRDDGSNQETLLSYSKLAIHKLLLLKRKHFALLLLIGLTGSFGAVSSSEVVTTFVCVFILAVLVPFCFLLQVARFETCFLGHNKGARGEDDASRRVI